MNGRVYDPFLGRMISADPTVPGAMNGQAFNRYSYVLNNPLALMDPSGFSPGIGICGSTPRCTPNADGAGGTESTNLGAMPNRVCNDRGCPQAGISGSRSVTGNNARWDGNSGTGVPSRIRTSTIGFLNGAPAGGYSAAESSGSNGSGITTYYGSYSVDSWGAECQSNICTSSHSFSYGVPNYTSANLTRFFSLPSISHYTGGSEAPTSSAGESDPELPRVRGLEFTRPEIQMAAVAEAFVPTDGQQIALNVVGGVVVTVLAPVILELSPIEAFGVNAAYSGVNIYDGFSQNNMQGGIAYSTAVVTIVFGAAFRGAPIFAGSVATGFDAWMGYVQYQCVRAGGC